MLAKGCYSAKTFLKVFPRKFIPTKITRYTVHDVSLIKVSTQHSAVYRAFQVATIVNIITNRSLLVLRATHLVNGAGDETLDILLVAEYLGEGGAESWDRLNGGKADLTDAVGVLETKDALGLVSGNTLLCSEDVLVKVGLRTAERFFLTC